MLPATPLNNKYWGQKSGNQKTKQVNSQASDCSSLLSKAR